MGHTLGDADAEVLEDEDLTQLGDGSTPHLAVALHIADVAAVGVDGMRGGRG